jgi:NitT/TauT family transport system substrate-binding protein
MTDYVLRAALKKASVPISDVTEVPLGAPPTTIAAMQHGDIDALVLPINFGYTPGTGTIAQKASALLGNNDQFAVLMAQDTYIASNTAVLKRLAVSYTDAINWMKTHKSATVSLAESALGMTAVVANKTYDALMPGFTPSGALNASGLAGYATVPAASSYLSTAVIGK